MYTWTQIICTPLCFHLYTLVFFTTTTLVFSFVGLCFLVIHKEWIHCITPTLVAFVISIIVMSFFQQIKHVIDIFIKIFFIPNTSPFLVSPSMIWQAAARKKKQYHIQVLVHMRTPLSEYPCTQLLLRTHVRYCFCTLIRLTSYVHGHTWEVSLPQNRVLPFVRLPHSV